jgi:hypothetical protein
MLWGDAVSKGSSAPIWMTFQQALELDAHVRKGERGSTVVYVSKITRTGTDADTGEETAETIPFLKSPRGVGSTGDSVFNSPTSILGAPAVTLPMLTIEGMPVGIQIVGQRHADARTAGIARWLLETVRPVSVD